MAELGTSGEGGDNRLGCHASVTMLWLEESAQGKQGGNQGDVCKFVFFLLNVYLQIALTPPSFTDVKLPVGL